MMGILGQMRPAMPAFTGLLQPTGAQDVLGADPIYQRNMQWAKPAPPGGYLTQLDPAKEAQFQQWVQQNKVPFDPSPTSDYDMRGFWQSDRSGTGVNPNDNMMHFPDTYKTPYHQSFSAESQWALPNAPTWNDKDQLVTPDGRIVFDERNR
jgi:hypothetical protein